MKLLQAKLAKYTAPQEAKAAGVYPYFRAISSEQEPEVIINGKKVLMFGSNCYSGLVSDPRIKEAAIEAIKKYRQRGCDDLFHRIRGEPRCGILPHRP